MTTFGKAKFQLHVYLPEETDKQIRRLARLENRTLTRQFVMLIEEALAARAAKAATALKPRGSDHA